MAAAYAALVSLTNIVDQIDHHPRPPLSLNEQQADSLTRNITFMLEFLETYTSHGVYNEELAQGLENRIADAAHLAEDVIESQIVDRILADASTNRDFNQSLANVIESMDLIRKEAMEIKEKLGEIQRSCSIRSGYTEQRLVTVGFDDELYELLDKLTGGDCRIISIVGMGGIGKTTLARKVFENQLIAYHFDIIAWITVSQEYSIRAILELLCVKIALLTDREILNEMSEDELGEKIYKSLLRSNCVEFVA